MSTKISEPRPIQITPGVKPITEGTELSTTHAVLSDKIRFFNGLAQKIGGWEKFNFDLSNTISGIARSIFSHVLSGRVRTMIGTHTRMYSLVGTELTNVTPLLTSSTAIANSLDTLYGTLANDPVTTVSGSVDLVFADTSASRLAVGDTITLSGSSAVNGVPAVDINAAQKVRAIGTNTFTITVSTAATSSGTGGGASVVRATRQIRLNSTAHDLAEGDRVSVSGAVAVGGITAPQINLEFVIRNVATNSFDIQTEGTATSSVTSGGGAGTVYFEQIAAGLKDEIGGSGYGAGKYGVGLYGTSLPSSSARSQVRTWFFDKFGDNIIACAGNQTGVYEWDADTTTAPVLVTNAPTAVNYSFVSNNILVTLGASGVDNKIFGSDQGNRTNWTSSSTNQVFEDNIEGAGRFLSHVSVAGLNLLFTDQQTYTFRYIGLPLIWEIKQKDPSIGIISPMARIVVGGKAFWMGTDNFYMWRSGNIEIVPANTQKQSTILRYVFDNINRSQASKIFCWYNEKFDEIWFHYPSAGSNEPDRIARVNLQDFSWVPDTMDRTSAEYPNANAELPKLIDRSGIMYQHEKGTDDNETAMSWSLKLNFKVSGKDMAVVSGIIPDSNQVGNISVNVSSQRYPQSTVLMQNKDYTLEPTTENIPITISGRFWTYTITGSELSQSWSMGQWHEEVQKGARN